MKFLADENLEGAIVALLRAHGHDVLLTGDDVPGDDDQLVLDRANREERVLVTNDKDFGTLVFQMNLATAGILLIRIGEERTGKKLESVKELLTTRHVDLLQGHFTVLSATKIRRRRLRRSSP